MQTVSAQKSDQKGVSAGGAFFLKDHGNGIFGLHFDLPGEKVNKLSPVVMEDLNRHLDEIATRKDIKALIFFSDKESIFIAGADITVIQTIHTIEDGIRMARDGQAVIEKIEHLPFPTIAAVHGAAMGGGTEFALCCKYIVVSDHNSTRIALPEVNLGVLPGFGGTVRLPRRIGLQTSLDYILTGKAMNGEKALKIGFADALLVSQDFHQNVLDWTAKLLAGKYKKAKTNQKWAQCMLEKNPLGRGILFSKARQMIMSKTRGQYPAPLKILEVLEANAGKSIKAQLKRESEAFGELATTEISKQLIHLFFATEKVKKQTGVQGVKRSEENKVDDAAVLGAGVMGGGIAQLLAQKKIPVRLKDIDYNGLALGIRSASKIFFGLVKKKKITKREAQQQLTLISPTTDYSGFGKIDVVIEAVVENMDVKKKVLQETEKQLKPTALFASNTSSLSITELAKASAHPENVVGMHFFNPVHKMPLIEVIRGEKTSDRAVVSVYELSKRLGKTPIVVKDGPGFLVNRLLMPYLNEASYLMAERMPIEALDEAVLEFGMPMGPATLLDEVGIDVATKVAKILYDAFGERAKPCELNKKLVEAKLLGKKSKKGFYLYDDQGKQTGLNPEIYSVLGIQAKTPSTAQKADWIARMIYPMINEAALCLEEKIVEDPLTVDLGMIMGTGFPPFRGGVLRYADSVGLQNIVAKLNELSQKVSTRFKPTNALVKFAQSGNKFYQ